MREGAFFFPASSTRHLLTPLLSFLFGLSQGSTALHWPLINTPHALEARLARRELEAKRAEDAADEERATPGWASPADRAGAVAFASAAAAALASFPDPAARAAAHIPALARYFLWDQTQGAVVVAVHVPGGGCGGGGAAKVSVSCAGGLLSIRRAGCPAVLSRRLAGPVCPATPPAVAVTADGRTAVVVLAKAAPGPPWRRLCVGDTDGDRAAVPPYRVVVEGAAAGGGGGGGGGPPPSSSSPPPTSTAILELSLPWWVTKEDVAVACTPADVSVTVASGSAARVVRRFRTGGPAVVAGETTWSLGEGGADPAHPGRHHRGKLLVVALVLAAAGGGEGGAPPPKKEAPATTFFEGDGDEFGLSAPLAGGVVAVGGVGTLRGDGDAAGTPVRARGDLPPGAGQAVFDVLSAARPARGAATPGAVEAAAGGASDGEEEGDEDDTWEF